MVNDQVEQVTEGVSALRTEVQNVDTRLQNDFSQQEARLNSIGDLREIVGTLREEFATFRQEVNRPMEDVAVEKATG